jgi:hypothetical protein
VVAPEPYLSACLEVLYRAAIYLRNHPHDPDAVFAVTDAVHNIPHLIQHWEGCDEALLRGMLQDCDAKHPTGLLAAYDFILERRVV